MWTNADWNEVKKVRDELDNFSEQTEVIESADNLIKSAKINEQRMNNGLPPLQNELYNMLLSDLREAVNQLLLHYSPNYSRHSEY